MVNIGQSMVEKSTNSNHANDSSNIWCVHDKFIMK